MHVIHHGKFLLPLLITLIYVHPSGTNFLSNLRDTVLAAESSLGSILETVQGYAKQFRNFHEIFDTAVEEHCRFKCPVEGVVPKPKYNHVPSSDGCGALGLKIKSDYLPIAEMTRCCDRHDICYETCNADKEMCDGDFKRCLYNFCDKYDKTVGDTVVKACKGAAKMLYTGTLTFGCKAFLDAQKNACYCPSYGWKDAKNSRYSKGDGDL